MYLSVAHMGEYLTHFTPGEASKKTPPAKVIANNILEFLKRYHVEKSLLAMGGDSTNFDTGYKGGTILLVEEGLGRRVSWLICQLHTNELPLRHLINDLDGPTASNNTFTGPLGKALSDVESLEYNPKFKPIKDGPDIPGLSQDVIDDLSTDQQYSYRMVVALMEDSVPMDLFLLAVGKVTHSRWLTTANRFMKIWVSHHGFRGKT